MKIPVSTPNITEEDVQAVTECVRSSWVSGISHYVTDFEEAYAKWNGSKYGIVTNSGTTALHLALASLKLPQGSEVIVPSFTMIASVNAILYLDLKPVFVDVDPDTWCISPESLRNAISKNTTAFMPVHIYGHICNMSELLEIMLDESLIMVEDAAEAHGAEYKGKKAGSFGEVGCFSFYANKIITTGEGGIIVTDDHDYAERCRWLRAHAFGRRGRHYWHEEVGYGYRMSGMQAALGLSQLSRIDEYVQKRQMAAWRYHSLLKDVEGLTFPVKKYGNMSNVYWMFSILLDEELHVNRNVVVKRLAERGIETRTFFYPVHDLPSYSQHRQASDFTVTNDISSRGINLPSGNQLTSAEIDYVCNAVKEILA